MTTLQEVRAMIVTGISNRRNAILTNIERLTDRMNVSEGAEVQRLNGLITIQENSLSQIDDLTELDIDAKAQERFSKIRTSN